jgi:POT family proton-dependent oligopeptide transporter
MVGKLYKLDDPRRDSGFTIFYMGINMGAFFAPILTQYLAQKVFNMGDVPAYKVVFFASGIGMLVSLVWFYIGRATLKGIGAPADEAARSPVRFMMVAIGAGLPVAED